MIRAAVAMLMLPILAVACTPVQPEDLTGVREVSRPLPHLAGPALADGSPISTGDYSGRVLVVNVWATWCTACLLEQPELARLAERYRSEGVRFLGIFFSDDPASGRSWVRNEFRVPYPSIIDQAGESAAALGYPFLPDTYVVDRSGTIRFQVTGRTNAKELAGLLDRVLA